MQDKIVEIRELAEMAIEQNRAKAFIETYALNLCDALDYAIKIINACQNLEHYSKSEECIENKAKIDQVLKKGKNGKEEKV